MRHSVLKGVGVVLALIVVVTARPGTAQQRELTTSDRLAILYAPQLDFTQSGDPFVRVGLMEGRDSIEFTPSRRIRVMPQGDEGAEVVLPADHTYRVEIREGEAGGYRHWVVVEALPVKQRDTVDGIEAQWAERGFEPNTFQVGGLFGIQGQVFDSRALLVGVGGTESHREAQKLRSKLERRYGIDGRVHSELTQYPGGELVLTGSEVDVEIHHRDVLWISAVSEAQGEVEYTVPGVNKSYNKGRETRTYGGRLIFSPDRDGKLALINKLGVERLLKGVVPSEIYTSAPKAALRAQAVAARNTVFGAIGVRNLADPYMVRSDVYDQVYKGLGAEHARTSRAVEATRGQVMFYDQRIVEAVYSANAGGFTEDNEEVWNAEPRPYLRGGPDAPDKRVPEPFQDGIDASEVRDFLESDFRAWATQSPLGSTELYRWEERVSAKVPLGWLDDHGHSLEAITDAEVLERGVSGRIVRLELTGRGGTSTVVERELNVRRLFGGLKSGLFVMDVSRRKDGSIESFHFQGAGYGHGVGMCQTGAMGMAASGKGHRTILKHYYDGIDIQTLY